MGENNFLKLEITDPEIIRKIQENGIESLDIDDLNSFGMDVKDGQLHIGDASRASLDGSRRIRMDAIRTENEEIGPWPLKRGFIGFIVAMVVLYFVLSIIGILCCKMIPELAFTTSDVFGLMLFVTVGLAISLREFRLKFVAKKYLTERVEGRCIAWDYASGKGRTKKSIYEYTYQGKVYRSSENVYASRGAAKTSEVRKLMISPENPRCIYDSKAGIARIFGEFIIGMIFIGLIAVIVVSEYVNG